ncbi:MAG: histone deacetylase [Anaerolineae bacterium]|jgi:acetoin utilization deacetylase AcuC-like enzyme|nr:histone deacetylase [Anaerolineae bacterium]
MKAFYCDDFVLPLPPEHRFPMRKYSGLRQRLRAEGVIALDNFLVPEAATDRQILRCHEANYLDRVVNGTLTSQEIRRIGFPWSLQMVERCRRSSGATIAACRAALSGDGIAVNLAGGTHHACRDHGEGYCVFNDAAIAARAMQDEGRVKRVVVIDCDVHQGNGTADIVRDDPTIFAFSIHGAKNFPFRKIDGDLDIALPDGTEDAAYLEMVEEGTWRAIVSAKADLAIYIAGADPFIGDRLGKLCISKEGLAERDRLVLKLCANAGLPVAIAMGGGYAHNVEDIIDIHAQTVRIAAGRERD